MLCIWPAKAAKGVATMTVFGKLHVTNIFMALYLFVIHFVASEPLYKGVTCFCSLQKCQMTNNLCTSYYGCYQMSIVVPEDPLSGDTEAATPSTYTALAACIESRSQNKTHCGPEQLYKQSSPNTVIKCCYKNLCNDITGNPYSGSLNSPTGGSNRYKSMLNINNQFPSNGGLRGTNMGGANSNREGTEPGSVPIWSSDFWFRIAVITVPITGAVILVFIIIVAIKVLRQEDMRTKILAQQKLQTLSALHRGCTEHYCHLTGSVISPQSDHKSLTSSSSKCDKLKAKNICQYSPTRHPPMPTAITNYSNQPVLSHELPKLINNNNISPYSKCDTIQVKPVVTRPPDICECHSPETAPTQILATARPSPSVTRPYASFHIYPKNGTFGSEDV